MYRASLLLLLLLIANVYGQCPDKIPMPSQNLCTNPMVLTPSSPGFNDYQYGGYDFSVYMMVKITDNCAVSATTPMHFMVVTLQVNGTQLRMADLFYDPNSNYITTNMTDNSGQVTVLKMSTNGVLNTGVWLELSALMSISTRTFKSGIGVAAGSVTYGNANMQYSGWVFDSSLKIYLCSDVNSTNPFSCSISDFRAWYQPSLNNGYTYFGGLTRYYRIDELTGTTIHNFLGPLGSGYLGDSPTSPTASTKPVWSLTDPAVNFTAPTQYITLPNFIPSPGNAFIPYSFSVNMWVQVLATPTSVSHFFSIYSADGTTSRFIFALSSDMKIGVSIGDGAYQYLTTLLPLNQWRVLTATLQVRSDLKTVRGVFFIGNGGTTITGVLSTNITFLTTDIVRIGGNSTFIGQLASFRLFSPGSINLASTCAVTDALDIGIENPPVALYCTANSYFFNNSCLACNAHQYTSGPPQFSSCVECPSQCITCTAATSCGSCITGYRLSSGSCVVCPAGTYSASSTSTSCSNCPTGCMSCTSFSSCQACNATSYVYNGSCVAACPSGFYNSSRTCAACPSQCTTCNSSSVCQSCASGYFFFNNQCLVSCPSGYYGINGTCNACSSPCATCSNSSACQSCISNYFLYNTQCLTACPASTYLSDGTCFACPTQCTACTSSSTCQNCTSNSFMYNSQCFAVCPSGTYASGNNCTNCTNNCLKCESSSVCTACASGYMVSGSQCVEQVGANTDEVVIISVATAAGVISVGVFFLIRNLRRRRRQAVLVERVKP